MSAPTAVARRLRGGDDTGFTLAEVLVSVAIIAVVMLGVGAVFVATAAGTDVQGQQQTAARIATGGLDRAHALTGATLATGRDQAAVQAQWNARPPGVRTLLDGLSPVSDPTAVGTGSTACGADVLTGCAPLPTTATASTDDGVQYATSFYLASCFLDPTAVCRGTAGASRVPMVDVVVAVAWRHRSCPASACTYQLSTLVSAEGNEPLFNSSKRAAPPQIGKVADQVFDVGEKVAVAAVTSTGGNGTVRYTAQGLPAGVDLDAATGVFTGAPTAPVPAGTVTVTATDQFGLYTQATPTWTVNPAPALTAATLTLPTGALTTSLDLGVVLARTGGTAAYTWACPGLPTGLTVAARTGLLSGTVPAGTAVARCTVTDQRSVTATAALTVTGVPLTVTSPVNGAVLAQSAAAKLVLTASGCVGTCTWSAAKLPRGLTLTATGLLTGTTTVAVGTTTTFTVTDSTSRTATATVTWTTG